MFNFPSMKALKIFICACRHNSFTLAANELNLSPGAISQHIKNLESNVGFELFTRHGRGVVLTNSGESFLKAIKSGLSEIEHVIEMERLVSNDKDLIVNAAPGFSIRWLYPRLMDFNKNHPWVNISINAVENPIDFKKNHAHAGIYYCPVIEGNNKRLFNEYLFPVCSPDFLKKNNLNRFDFDCKELSNLPLIFDKSTMPDGYDHLWDYWLHDNNLSLSVGRFQSNIFHPISNISLQLAELGHGIAMGRSSLVMDAMKKGQLVSLSKMKTISPLGYQIQENPALKKSPALGFFHQWLKKSSEKIFEAVIN